MQKLHLNPDFYVVSIAHPTIIERPVQDMSAQGARLTLPQNMKQAHFYDIPQSHTV